MNASQHRISALPHAALLATLVALPVMSRTGVCRAAEIRVDAGRKIGAIRALHGVNGGPIWCGVALALYVAGLGYLAQHESSRRRAPYWPLALLAVPIVFAMLINAAEFRVPAMWLSLVLALWIALQVRTVFQAAETNVGHIVSGLFAGIVLVDWLAVAPWCPQWQWLSLVFLILFGATLSLQRFVPAA